MLPFTGQGVQLIRSAFTSYACPHPNPFRGAAKRSNEQRSVAAGASKPEVADKPRSYADMTIDDLDTDYCNDFVCTSSPAVEQTIRSLARDITRLK